MGLFDILKKKETQEEKVKAPDLMAEDPAANESVNLMADDPINTAPPPPMEVEAPLMDEAPSIEEQLTAEPKAESSILSDVIDDSPKVSEAVIPDAFSMSAPVIEETPKEEPIEITEEESSVEIMNINTNVICKNCGTPNDLLNKFCVSCGEDL